jgi:methionyl-tRNA synthetase
MSKSIGNVIDPNQLVDQYGSDAARYLILSQFPFGNDGDIKADDFKTKFNADLANGIGNLVSRVLGMVEKYFENKVPDASFGVDVDMKQWWKRYDEQFSRWQVFENLQEILKLVALTDGYIAANKPWELEKTDREKLAVVLYSALELIRHLSLAILPYLPETSAKIWEKLHLTDVLEKPLAKLRVVGGLKKGAAVEKGEALFMRK